jgi:hypothetical protein
MGSSPLAIGLSLTTVTLLAATPGIARAQDAQDVAPPPAHVAYVDGSATIERDGVAESATGGVPVLPGDRIRTTTGRVEMLFTDGSALDVDEYSTIDVQALSLLRLTAGRVLLVVAGASDPSLATTYQLDTPVGSITTEGPGEYRVALLSLPENPDEAVAELAAFRGSATLQTETGSTRVRAGERSLARGGMMPSYPLRFNSARFDAFDRWAADRRDDRMGTSASTQYLPSELQMYGGTFDRYGAWEYDASYGPVWYPSVAASWRPYFYGHWSAIRPYGWTWIGHDPWGWPTHHYGRWGFARNRWFWIPRAGWGAAWVSWAAAPGFVSWCPLGFDSRPVFGLSASIVNPWAGWVVVPRARFGGRAFRVSQHAVSGHLLGSRAHLVVQDASPAVPRLAVPRAAFAGGAGAAIPTGPVTRRAVPRSPAPSQGARAGSSSSASRQLVGPAGNEAVGGQWSNNPANRRRTVRGVTSAGTSGAGSARDLSRPNSLLRAPAGQVPTRVRQPRAIPRDAFRAGRVSPGTGARQAPGQVAVQPGADRLAVGSQVIRRPNRAASFAAPATSPRSGAPQPAIRYGSPAPRNGSRAAIPRAMAPGRTGARSGMPQGGPPSTAQPGVRSRASSAAGSAPAPAAASAPQRAPAGNGASRPPAARRP